MKQDFMLAKEELSQIGIVRVAADFYIEPKKRGSVFFVKSPATHDKTASLALYLSSNRFCDFANGNKSGDCISFVAYIRDCNQWEALKELQAFYRALWGEIDRLTNWAAIWQAIEKALYEPFSDTWTYCVNELQKADYWLDILCAPDCKTYIWLKAYHENLPSNHYEWLLDALGVLQEQGAFTATVGELEEITAQRDFELTRQPGMNRRCAIGW